MEQLHFKSKVPVSPKELAEPKQRKFWMEKKNMKVFSFYNDKNPLELIDIFVENPMSFEELDKRKENIRAFGLKLPVVCVEDLIIIKKKAGRLQDESDVAALRKILENS